MNKISKWWKGLTIPEKAGVFIVGSALGYSGYKLFSSEKSTALDAPAPGGSPSFSQLEFNSMADAIEMAIYAGAFPVTEDDTLIAAVLKRMRKDRDVYELIKAYGMRGGTLLTTDINLVQAISNFLDNDLKAEVNSNYGTKGIAYRWS